MFKFKKTFAILSSVLMFCSQSNAINQHKSDIPSDLPIKLYWWKSGDKYGNFGDELSAKIIKEVFGKNVEWSSTNNCDMMACGSIIEHMSKEQIKDKIVWTSGFRLEGDGKIGESKNIVGVRGKLSDSRVKKFENQNLVLGDLGLLSSKLLNNHKQNKKYKIGFIPHLTEINDSIFKNDFFKSPDVKIISPLDECKNVIKQISECECIVSSSLHGLIVSDSLHIPNCYFQINGRKKDEGMYKYYDYYSVFSKERLKIIYSNDIINKNLDANSLKNTILKNYVSADDEIEKIKENIINSFSTVEKLLYEKQKCSYLKTGTYEIISKLNTNKSLDIQGANKQSGANLQLYDKNNTDAQKFNIVYDGNGYYTIQAKCSGKMLDVPRQSKKSGTKIWQYDKNNTVAQKWKIIKNNDGTYSFVSKCNGLYLDVTSGNTSNGTLLQCYQGNRTNAQKFFINDKNKFSCMNKEIDGFNCGNIGSFITEENKSKKVLLVEFNPYHHECVPGYVKYFLNLGYEVDVFMLSGYEDCFSKFDRNEKLNIYTFKNYGEIYENSMILSTIIEKYKFIFLNSIETQHRPLNEIEIFKKSNTIAVAHTTTSLKEGGNWHFRDIFKNFINEKRIVTLGKFNVGTFVNPHYFGKIDNHVKNKKTNFIAVGNIYSSNRNYNMLIDAVKKLKSKNLDFKITIVGRAGSLNVPQEIKEYFNPKGSVSYRGLYEEVDNSDYMLMLLDPKNKNHLRYKTSNVTGNAQLCYGFAKPPIISNGFSDFYKFNNNNSIIYSNDLAAAMEKAIKMDENNYFNLQKNLKETANGIFNNSANNLKNILKH